MRVWAIVYCALRTSLIVLFGLCCSRESLTTLNRLAPLLSLMVAVGTSLDTWLNTGNRYRGRHTFNDKLIALQTDLEPTQESDTAALAKVKDQFKKLMDA